MSTPTTGEPAVQRADRSELLIAGFLFLVGVGVVVDAASLSTNIAQRGPVGPAAVPYLLGSLLMVVAIVLAVQVLRGGRAEPEGGEDIDLSAGTDWRTVGLVIVAFAANMVLIEPLGWPISGAILFFLTAFALGSRHVIRDAIISVVLSVGSWYLFVLGLGISLPVGVLKGIL